MDFQFFINSKRVIKGEKDIQKAKALIKMSKKNLSSIKEVPFNDNTASIILVMSYESLRQILEAMTLLNGYKVFSHEAYTYYLVNLNELAISNKFDRYRKLRNGINYYGKPVTLDVARNSLEDIEILVKQLIKKYF